MRTPRFISFSGAIAASAAMLCLLPARSLHAEPRHEKSHIERALELMEISKKDEHPVRSLEEAKEFLHKAEHHEGERRKAIIMLDEAIDEAKLGHHEKMRFKIDHAIDDVRDSLRHH